MSSKHSSCVRVPDLMTTRVEGSEPGGACDWVGVCVGVVEVEEANEEGAVEVMVGVLVVLVVGVEEEEVGPFSDVPFCRW